MKANTASELSAALGSAFAVEAGGTYLDTCDAARVAGHDEDTIRSAIASYIDGQPLNPLTPRLARVRWGAILNFSIDLGLEHHLREQVAKDASQQPTVVIDLPATATPPRCVPIYKVLGTAGKPSLVVSKYEYARARPRWRIAMRAFLDLVKSAPVLCLGMTDMPTFLADFLAELSSSLNVPRQLLALETDPLIRTGDLERMLDPRIELVSVSGAVGDLITAAEAGRVTPGLGISPSQGASGPGDVAQFSDIAVRVHRSHTVLDRGQRGQLLELLFSPASTQWDPLVHDLDFKRSVTAEVEERLTECLTRKLGDMGYVLDGGAASGKTVVLRRTALNLADKGHLVLWARPYFYPDASVRLNKLFQTLGRTKSPPPVCVVIDDPFAFGALSPREVAAAAQANSVRCVFLFGVRTSEWTTRDTSDLLGPLTLLGQSHVPDELDDAEWASLTQYLQDLGVARTRGDAVAQLDGLNNRSARDTLSMLYWLLPETRNHISESIRDEYVRLGDRAGFTRVVLGQAQHSSDLLRRAYEMVAVSDKYRASIPIEVLVSALDVDYHSWATETTSSQSAWGLICADENASAESIVYRTRNTVVTNTLVEALNTGSLSRAGELRILRTIIDACTGSHPAYREYCERILVHNDVTNSLDFRDGEDLFTRAIGALPYPDKALTHHLGRWVRNKGNDPLRAISIYSEAIKLETPPYAKRTEANEYIHTSIAAATIDAMERGLVDVAVGKDQALHALSRARSTTFFNANAVHSYATLAFKLSERLAVDAADRQRLIAVALADVDRTVLVLQADPNRDGGADVEMLSEVRDRIVTKTLDVPVLRAEAQLAWERRKDPEGFALVARALLCEARQSAKGRHFNSTVEYCRECITQISHAGQPIPDGLHDVRLQAIYEWRVRGYRSRPNGGPIDWTTFHSDALALLPSMRSPLYRYFEGLALAHLGRWQESLGAFQQVRQAKAPARVLWARRDMLLDRVGDLKVVQGTVRMVNDRTFINVDDFSGDLPGDRDGRWPRHGEIVMCYIQFSFGGPTAIVRG